MKTGNVLLLAVLLIAAAALLFTQFPPSRPLLQTPTPTGCTLSGVSAIYAAKISGGPEIEAAARGARADFDAAQDDEALVFKAQILENERTGTITPAEREQLFNAIAVHRFARDRIRYSIGNVGIANAKGDIATLESGEGKCDEKSLLLMSMLRYFNISSRMEALSTENAISNEACAQEGLCSCLARANHALVAAELPAFQKLRVFAALPHYTNATYCMKGDFIFLDPACAACPFAYGKECTSSIPILTIAANQTAG